MPCLKKLFLLCVVINLFGTTRNGTWKGNTNCFGNSQACQVSHQARDLLSWLRRCLITELLKYPFSASCVHCFLVSQPMLIVLIKQLLVGARPAFCQAVQCQGRQVIASFTQLADSPLQQGQACAVTSWVQEPSWCCTRARGWDTCVEDNIQTTWET